VVNKRRATLINSARVAALRCSRNEFGVLIMAI
jgi:hypothetical protein